jgi:predicted protein tyrosine phosphatase
VVNKVIFVSRTAAEYLSGNWKDWAIISISDPLSPGEAKLQEELFYQILRVGFHDVLPDRQYDEPTVLMVHKDAQRIVEFVRLVAPNVEGILVHCKAGISRSAAVAKWICESFDLPFSDRYTQFNQHVYTMLVTADNNQPEA